MRKWVLNRMSLRFFDFHARYESNDMLRFVFGVVMIALCHALAEGGVQSPLYHLPVLDGQHRPLIVKSYPAVENYQSDLYEVYMEPYGYDLRPKSAIAVINGEGESAVKGELTFKQPHPPAGPVLVEGNLTGLAAGKHGMHIHQSGDMRQGCEKLGDHFNPFLLQHGGPGDSLRHVGDLGNVEAKEDGTAEVKFIDPLLSLSGGHRSIVGRSIVLTENEDDLGRGGTAESYSSGASGKPIACGIIAYIH